MTTSSVPVAAIPQPGLPAASLPFPLLKNPAAYLACAWDLTKVPAKCTYWLGLFRWHFPKLAQEAIDEAADLKQDVNDARRRITLAEKDFFEYLDALQQDPAQFGRLDILQICYARERVLRRHGFADPYRLAKRRANDSAMPFVAGLFKQIDALESSQRMDVLTRGVFAGNIFDLGATKTLELFQNGATVDFHSVLSKLKPRPWLIDGLDAWLARLAEPKKHRCAVMFVDNAGCDILLGMIPLARELLRRGSQVILTANTYPSLNDVTIEELHELIGQIASWDSVLTSALRHGELELVASGNGAPLIDLSRISPELAAAVTKRNADLVILEGMGRGVESNLDAQLSCDAMKIAMIKDEGVADSLGGSLYDLVLRFDRA